MLIRRSVLGSATRLAGLILLACPPAVAAQADPDPAAPVADETLEQFAWLAGTWEGSLDVGDGIAQAEVQYLPPVAGTIVGSFRLTKDGRVLVIELFSLVATDGGIEMRIRHFGRGLEPWEEEDPIVLTLVDDSGGRSTFRNHIHDSPRWSYLETQGPDRFRAWSEIVEQDGGIQEIDITYRRQGDRGSPGSARVATGAVALADELEDFIDLLGSWNAGGDGFRSVLTYTVGSTGRSVQAANVLYGEAGKELARYEGAYVWDPSREVILFQTVSSTGEVHVGEVTSDGGLWHAARVAGGRIDGYVSLIEPADPRQLEYRAVYHPQATREEVRASDPLVYRRADGGDAGR